MAPGPKICFQFREKGTCRWGNRCKYSHDLPEQQKYEPATDQRWHRPNSQRDGDSEFKDVDETKADLRAWRKKVEFSGPLGDASVSTLQSSFSQAKELLDSKSPDVQHQVIRTLADDAGLKLVRAATEASPASLKQIAVPFLQVITHPDAISSLVLEQHIGTIYNVLYGLNGTKGRGFFSKILELLRQMQDDPSQAEDFQVLLAHALDVFRRMTEINQAAAISKDTKDLAQAYEAIGANLFGPTAPQTWSILSANDSIRRIRIMLDLGQEMPEYANEVAKITDKIAEFHLQQDLPGTLCRTGPRHDNDFVDITRISILPTANEIWSPMSEYLPTKQAGQQHLKGIRALLDRQFRLLREDTVGQLRDAIRAFSAKSNRAIKTRQGSHKDDIRTKIFQKAVITGSFFDKNLGLLHIVDFDQPHEFRALPTNSRKKAWAETRDLSIGSCVCMMGAENQVTFYSVVERTPASVDADTGGRRPLEDSAVLKSRQTTLHLDPRRAAVILQLVNQDGAAAAELLSQQHRHASQSSTLIEFPGTVLASFSYTLSALQQMSKRVDLPFSDLIAPDHTAENAALQNNPPDYARREGFSFNLSEVTGGRGLRFSLGQPFDLAAFSEASGLDFSQSQAFIHGLSHRMAQIQGPPGTGKSFLGVKLIRTLLQNRNAAQLGPIICVCYTNHALDQILEHLVANGVDQIVRIGGRSKSEALASVNLKEVARKIERTKNDRWLIAQALSSLEDVQSEAEDALAQISSADSITAIKKYLQSHHPSVFRHFFGDEPDEDGWQQVKDQPEKAFRKWLNGGRNPSAGTSARGQALQDLTHQQRQDLCMQWIRDIRAGPLRSIQDLCEDFQGNKRSLDSCHSDIKLRCLRQARVIGITTTGLAKEISLLKKLRSKVLVVEEAGEIMEAHMLPALLPSLEHVIAIGDHQQLRPSVANYELSIENPRGAEFALDVSLFERLIYPDPGLPQIPLATLQTQRRMHPSISRLIRETIYPVLVDGGSVANYPPVTSMRHRLFWFDHRHLENADPKEMSKSNDFEVEMTAGLVSHLVKQGTYGPGQITVLTPYLAQLRKLRRRFANTFEIVVGEKDEDKLVAAGLDDETTGQPTPHAGHRASINEGLRISTVDNYQGEESDIIVVSLVRSNESGKVGFLRTPNRINVLLSRARHGMYIIGNAEVAKNVSIWDQVIKILDSENAVGTALSLFCERHPETEFQVSIPEDFSRFSPEGGCNLICEKRLACGHSCVNKCHAQYLHDSVVCQVPCPRMRQACSHRCKKICGVACDKQCQAKVHEVSLPCGHVAPWLRCFETKELDKVKCQHEVEKVVPMCKHSVKVCCHQDVTDKNFQCSNACGALLPCGHHCLRPCSQCNTIDEHQQRHTRHGPCIKTCDRNRTTCSHFCNQNCHGDEPCKPCNLPCEVRCVHSKCGKRCSEPCDPCAEACAWECEHEGRCKLPCSVPCSRLPCSKRCEKKLACGHQCPSVCGEQCPARRFCQVCGDPEILQAEVDYIMFSNYVEVDLAEDPVIVPPCGHLQTVSSFDGHMDLGKFYDRDADGRIISVSGVSLPFEVKDIKICPQCRGTLRSINRYNRIVKRGLIDESTKRFIVWANARFVQLEQKGHGLEKSLAESVTSAIFQNNVNSRREPNVADHDSVILEGYPKAIFSTIIILPETTNRYKNIGIHRRALGQFCDSMSKEELPFRRIRNLCRSAFPNDDGDNPELANFDNAGEMMLNTRNHLLARSLLMHLDIAILSDCVEIWTRSRNTLKTTRNLVVDTAKLRDECLKTYDEAGAGQQPIQQVEALIHFAFCVATESRAPKVPAKVEMLRAEALNKLDEAVAIIQNKPSAGVMFSKVESARVALTGSFQSIMTDDEMRAVYAAMATEFRGTGHWYRCENGHPFTIGECGMPMQLARCPQCGATIGGQHHTAHAGVQRGDDIERQFGRGR